MISQRDKSLFHPSLRSSKKAAIFFIKFYQEFISPSFGTNCRFHPSCSEYCRQAIEKYGLIKGIWLGVKRIIKCNPWFQGGIDLP